MTSYQDFISGYFGGVAGCVVGHPFDTVKVRLQTQSTIKPIYNGTFDCFAKIIQKESIFGLYKGMSSPLYCLAFINALIFGLQANISKFLSNSNDYRSICLSGMIAGGVQTFICSPMELCKTYLQMQGVGEKRELFKLSKTYMYQNAFDCVYKIYKMRGLKGLYRGFYITLARELPAFGLYFTVFKFYCENFSTTGNESTMRIWELLVAGGLSGTFGWILTYPIDVIKTRYQSDGMGCKYKYLNIRDCIRKSYRQDGLKVFQRGLLSTILRAFPTNAATFATVSLFNNYYSKHL